MYQAMKTNPFIFFLLFSLVPVWCLAEDWTQGLVYVRQALNLQAIFRALLFGFISILSRISLSCLGWPLTRLKLGFTIRLPQTPEVVELQECTAKPVQSCSLMWCDLAARLDTLADLTSGKPKASTESNLVLTYGFNNLPRHEKSFQNKRNYLLCWFNSYFIKFYKRVKLSTTRRYYEHKWTSNS